MIKKVSLLVALLISTSQVLAYDEKYDITWVVDITNSINNAITVGGGYGGNCWHIPIRNDFYQPFYIIEKGTVRKTTTEILREDDWNGYTDHCKTTNTDYEYIDKSMITMVDMRYVELKAHYNPANPSNNYWEVVVDDQPIYKTSMIGYPNKLKPYVHLNVQQRSSGTVISATIGTQDGSGINDMPFNISFYNK